ncbi:hypothetical protein DKX38_001919 [Salix brachista]|uniref:Uncharacterized protein n=1 Tax=Salix brachista TaxID=2182728 RepID=A0A5N5NPF5_9ROSI|nr:hypothetical protein DKX38_001919 [Salix brachista]
MISSTLEHLEKSPFLERLEKKGYEVIYFTGQVDDYLMQYMMDYQDKKFQNVFEEGLKLGKESKAKELEESFKELTKWWKSALARENVDDVRISNSLDDTACVVDIKTWMESKYEKYNAGLSGWFESLRMIWEN